MLLRLLALACLALVACADPAAEDVTDRPVLRTPDAAAWDGGRPDGSMDAADPRDADPAADATPDARPPTSDGAPADRGPPPPPADASVPTDPPPPFRPVYPDRRVGIFYLLWHAYASDAMRQVPEGERHTIETILRTGRNPSEVLLNRGLMQQAAAFHYHVEPELGFYCMYRPRPGDAPYPEPDAIADCPDIPHVAETHARLLWDAGVDFIYLDLTNLPFYSRFADVLGVRPVEVLAEEWAALRLRGVATPQLAAWVPMTARPGDVADGWTWEAVVNHVYRRPEFDDLILRDRQGRKILFAVDHGGLPVDAEQVNRAQAQGDIVVVRLWGLLSPEALNGGQAAWMQPCEAPGPPNGALTFTTLVHPQNPCGQRHTPQSPIGSMISVSTSFQLGYASLPFQAAGRSGGMTLKRQFATAFDVAPDWLLINSWNELIAQPQSDAFVAAQGDFGRSMGMAPGDASSQWLWVDTYGGEFSRDIEPTREYGDTTYQLLRSCLRVYRAGGCGAAPGEACCDYTPEHTLIFSARQPDPGHRMTTDHVPTADFNELGHLLSTGWEQVCNAFYGPPSLCSTGDITGDGPFLLFARDAPGRRALYRCYSGADHFISPDAGCEGRTQEGLLGYADGQRTSAAPRALSRCHNPNGPAHFHWLADHCPNLPGVQDEGILGFVR